MNQKKNEKVYLTPQEVADLLMVSPVTVRQWAKQGRLAALNTPGGHRRFLLQDVDRFALDIGLRREPAVRVLIVDDDPQFADMLKKLLLSRVDNLEVEVAHDGFDAGSKVHTFRPHVVLLDLMMPALNGLEVCRQLKRDPSTRSIRVVAMSGYPSRENIAAAVAAGASKCLAKSLDMEDLLCALGILDKAFRIA